MNAVEYALRALDGLRAGVEAVDAAQTEALIDAIVAARKIYVAGAGRSLLMLRAFAMRLMHIGLPVFVVGETVTPALEAGDLLIVGSGSGETGALALMADKAKKLGARLAVITTFPESTLGKAADTVLRLAGKSAGTETNNIKGGQPGGSIFEQTMLLLLDCLILRIADRQGIDMKQFKRHANLE